MTAAWDVFHSVKLEVERGVATDLVRAKLRAGSLNGDDLIRPSGTTRWSRISQVAAFNTSAIVDLELEPEPELRLKPEPALDELVEPAPLAPVELPPPPMIEATHPAAAPEPGPMAFDLPDDDDDDDYVELEVAAVQRPGRASSRPAFEPPLLPDDEAGGPRPPELDDPEPAELEAPNTVEDDPSSDFTLSRNSTETVEELDLAAMVDVAFQLVLFFLVTASTIVFKTLEVPRPNEDKPPEAAAQSRARTIDELEKDYILVEVDAEGGVKIDHLPVASERAALVEKLRQARESTGRKAMLLSADFATRHKNAVLAFDVASEIDLQIAIAQPTGKN